MYLMFPRFFFLVFFPGTVITGGLYGLFGTGVHALKGFRRGRWDEIELDAFSFWLTRVLSY